MINLGAVIVPAPEMPDDYDVSDIEDYEREIEMDINYESGNKDAVHVAVISCWAGEDIEPGDYVSFNDDYRYGVMKDADGCGIADPFRKETIKKHEVFWVLMRPNTVDKLSHTWSHKNVPDFNSAQEAAAEGCKIC